MNRLFLLVFALSSFAIQANNIDQFEEERLNKKQIEMIQERMEEAPSSTAIGGARGGQLDFEKRMDEDRLNHDVEKQRQLYEYEDRYRRGL